MERHPNAQNFVRPLYHIERVYESLLHQLHTHHTVPDMQRGAFMVQFFNWFQEKL